MVRPSRDASASLGPAHLERRFERFGREAERFLVTVEGPAERRRWVANPPMLGLLRGKWNPEILLTLDSSEGCGFEELRRALGGITPRVLSARLVRLQKAGFIRRLLLDLRPPRVKYSLTRRGRTLARISAPTLVFLRYALTEPGRARGRSSNGPGRPRL